MLKTDDIAKCIAIIKTAYPNYKIENREVLFDLWMHSFDDMEPGEVAAGIDAYIRADRSGFAPSIGQIRAAVRSINRPQQLTEGQAWNMVYQALCNSNYHANEEFNKLPPDVRRAVGGPDQLREWAAMDFDGITVAESNFKRAYRGVADADRKNELLPDRLKAPEDIPVAAITDKSEEPTEGGPAADMDKVHELLDGLSAKWDMPIRDKG